MNAVYAVKISVHQLVAFVIVDCTGSCSHYWLRQWGLSSDKAHYCIQCTDPI